jgi:hypothetical protein
VALVSFTSPKRLLYVSLEEKDKYRDPSEDKTEMNGQSWAPTNQPDADLQSLCDFAFQTFEGRLTEISQWKFIPFETVRNAAAYKAFKINKEASPVKPSAEVKVPAFMKKLGVKSISGAEPEGVAATEAAIDVSQYRAATGMQVIPVGAVTDGTKRWGNQDPFKEKKERLAQLAKDLNVDAVALVEYRAAYRYGKAASLQVGQNVKAVPLAASSMVMVNKEGKVVAETGPVRSKLNMDYEGESVTIARKNTLKLDLPETRTGFEAPIKLSADRMKEIILDAYGKLK